MGAQPGLLRLGAGLIAATHYRQSKEEESEATEGEDEREEDVAGTEGGYDHLEGGAARREGRGLRIDVG